MVAGDRSARAQFFKVTGVLLIIFAAGLLSRTVLFLQSAGDLGISWNNVYDLTRYSWLTTGTEVGKFLGAMFGWDPRPSIEQIVAYLGYALTVGYLFLRRPKQAQPAPSPAPKPESAAHR
jgi:high-affinity iron transporter